MTLKYKRTPKDVLTFIDTLRDRMERYHDQKDKMAYAVGALIVSFGAAYTIGNLPPSWALTNRYILLLYFVGLFWLWGLGHFILCFQLKCKRGAAIWVRALINALLEAYATNNPLDFTPQKINRRTKNDFGPIKNIIYIMTLHPKVFYLSDLLLFSGPTFLVSAFDKAAKEGTGSSYIEWATWSLSVWCLIVVFGKTIASIYGLPYSN